MTIDVVDDLEAVACVAAANVERIVAEHDEASRFVVALSGGSTPIAFHAELASHHRDRIAWNRIDVFVSDERAVDPTDERSNIRMIRETLLDPLGDSAPTLIAPTGIATDPASAAADYNTKLLEHTHQTGACDLVMLGMGPDGHTASLFPGFEVPAGLIAAVEAPADNVVRHRISFTYDALERAKNVIILVSGESKAGMLAAIWERREDHPLTRVLIRRKGHVLLIADQAAASKLTESKEIK